MIVPSDDICAGIEIKANLDKKKKINAGRRSSFFALFSRVVDTSGKKESSFMCVHHSWPGQDTGGERGYTATLIAGHVAREIIG